MNKTVKMTAVLTAAMLALAGCGGETTAVSAEAAAIAVGAKAAETGSITRETAYAGRIAPGESVYVIGKVPGTVKETYAEVGDAVKAGQLLYEIDTVDVELTVAQTKAAYESAQASVNQALGSGLDGQVLSAESAYKQAKFGYEAAEEAQNAAYDMIDAVKALKNQCDNLSDEELEDIWNATETGEDVNNQKKYKFQQTLKDTLNLKSGATSDDVKTACEETLAKVKAAAEKADIAYDQAKTGYTSARTAYLLTTGDATEQAQAVGNASLQTAKAAYDATLAQLAYCKVTSPIDGIVELKNVTVNGMASSASYSYVISNKNTMSVTFGVPADVARMMEAGDPIVVENGSVTHTASIVEVATMVDAASGLFKIKANITDDASDLLTGIAVKLTATTARSENTILVPTAALYYDDGSAYLYVAADGVAVKTPVVTGIISGDMAEIVEGVDEGDLVITTWNTNLRDGATVTVQEV